MSCKTTCLQDPEPSGGLGLGGRLHGAGRDSAAAAAYHVRHRWLSLTTSFLVQHSPPERQPLTSSRVTYSV
ncbi:hypothetical protein MRX96_030040 [Rhipicephalus microplus]